jgi:L-erythro-3,5-diaminohexanoate dehydrogenase
MRRARARAPHETVAEAPHPCGAHRLTDIRERLGVHRVVDPPGDLPQPAWRLDPSVPLRASETEVAVERLSVDAVSFRQLWDGDEDAFARRLLDLVAERGKLHNPDTDSGGTLLGTVTSAGERRDFSAGDRVVALASTSAIPLALERVLAVRPQAAEVLVEGRAVLAEALPAARVPDDLEPALAVAAADVAGAPGLVHDLLPEGGTFVVLGGSGSAGLLACAAALARGARILAIDLDVAPLERAGVAEPLRADARDALAVADALAGVEADVVAQVATAPGCEASAVAAVAPEGTIVYFSLATSFQRCVNVADIFGKRPRMLIATALRLHHAPLAWELLRAYAPVRAELGRRLGIS